MSKKDETDKNFRTFDNRTESKSEKRKLYFTKSGFGVKKVSERSVRKNLDVLIRIAKEAGKAR